MQYQDQTSITAIRNKQKADPVMTMGQEIVSLKLNNMQKDSLIQTMGEQLALVKLELIQLKGGGN